MKPGLRFLNSKEIKDIKKRLNEYYGFEKELDYAFLKNEKNKVYIITKEVDKISLEALKISTIGLYFLQDNGEDIRLSIEGSQIVGPFAIKSIVELDKASARQWLKGYDIDYPGSTPGYVIIKSGKDFLGSAKHKDGKLLNHVPKERRIRASD